MKKILITVIIVGIVIVGAFSAFAVTSSKQKSSINSKQNTTQMVASNVGQRPNGNIDQNKEIKKTDEKSEKAPEKEIDKEQEKTINTKVDATKNTQNVKMKNDKNENTQTTKIISVNNSTNNSVDNSTNDINKKNISNSQKDVKNTSEKPIVVNQIYVTPYNIDGSNPIMSVQSNSQIQELVLNITKNDNTDLEKAKSIYNWITSNISYNDELENEVLKGTNTQYSVGAINTFETRSGICYGYSTLFVAMANDVGLNVELIGGNILNNDGKWENHAWNKVLCNGTWVNIDCTYGVVENEFNTSNFNSTHKMTILEGHWD